MARYSIGDIEGLLFAAFPASDALPDDRIGLFVGDRRTIVTKIAIALDQSVPMIEAAVGAGCNLLVTHHPPFMYAPDSFLAAPSPAISNGTVIYQAAHQDVALLNMHTNLDCAPVAADMLLKPVGLAYSGPLRAHGTGSLGQLACPAHDRAYIPLGELAQAYRRAFGPVAKVWGDAAKPLFTMAVCSGGASEVVGEVIAAKVDCFITGEVRHHEALYLADANISLIELGHDNSELPYRSYLKQALVSAGVSTSDIVVLNPSADWWHPVQEEPHE